MKYLVIVLGIIILLLCGVIIYKNHQYNKLQVQTTEKPIFAPVLQKSDKNGNNYVEIKQTLYTQDQMNKVTDSLRRVYKSGKIVGQVQIVTKLDTISQIIPIYIHDTLITVVDSNRYIKQSFQGNLNTNSGQFHLDLTNDTMTYIDAVKYRIFKANEHNIIINHSNPYLSTISGNAIKLKEKKVQAVFGPYFGFGYSPMSNRLEPTLGLSLTYNLISIYKK